LLKFDIGLSSSCRVTATRQPDDAPSGPTVPSHLTQASGAVRHPGAQRRGRL